MLVINQLLEELQTHILKARKEHYETDGESVLFEGSYRLGFMRFSILDMLAFAYQRFFDGTIIHNTLDIWFKEFWLESIN